MSTSPSLPRPAPWRLACRLRVAALVLATAALAARAGAPAAGGTPCQALPATVARIRAAVAAVGTYNPANRPPMEFSASGFFIDDRGYFLTADHVIVAFEKRKRLSHLRIFMHTLDDRRGIPATVLARMPRYDLALLKAEGDAYPCLEIGDSTKVREGQAIAVMGFPFGFLLGLHPSTTAGIISNVSPIAIPAVNTRHLDAATIDALRHPFDVFQLDAIAYPGNSGGPVFDPVTGRVLGVVNRAFIRKTKEKVFASGISYAVPIHYARKLLEKVPAPDTTDAARPNAPVPKAP
ncbi:trypsin-like peptidase domain-containing protein [bacterium]|nr:trypsin-like peptidase domain-containing protein [bacterium]